MLPGRNLTRGGRWLLRWTVTEVDVLEQSHEFGRELRRRRLAAELSLERLGKLVHYSKGQLSKVERGLKPPTPELARLCDTHLKAGGGLADLVPHQAPAARNVPDSSQDGEVWLMRLGKNGSSSFQRMDRRQVIAAGASSFLAMGVDGIRLSAEAGGMSLVDASRALFVQFRQLGQTAGPGAVLPPLIAQTHSLEQLAARSGPRARRELLILASRYAEYTGWMAQESGNDEAALWWTDRAVALATACEDHGLATYGLVRRALISLFGGDVARAIALAEAARDSDAPPRVQGLAAQKLAQSHAVAGDHTACMRSLDHARELLALDAREQDAPVIGTSQLTDVVSMFTGWCLYELGRPQQAAETLDQETAKLPQHALRSRSRYGVRMALAHATAGEIDHACELTHGLLDTIGLVHSATIGTDLRRLARVLGRHPRNHSVRSLNPDLSAVLTTTTA
ncbi:helix-turn-helix protein [Streptomyces malaysiensis subsp. malaysiensis]|uniref:helix-turn-helix domain-containing protein n=1 Tax=Streptomyces sp. SID8382 TaxID=2690362 RepID=UPI000CA23C6B|nr:helix-turn-helix protein [Streptomyces sp. M56]